jgi:FkbM family methyltransferase
MFFLFGRSKKRIKEIYNKISTIESKINSIHDRFSDKNNERSDRNALNSNCIDNHFSFKNISEHEAIIGHSDQAFGAISYAQHGDDFITLNLFNNIGITKPSYLDIGAHHPYNISNTALLYRRGCRGVNVEANPNLITAFEHARPEDINLNLGVSDKRGKMTFYMIDDFSGRNTFDKKVAEEFITAHPEFSIQSEIAIETVTVNDIVRDYCNGQFPDFLTIDVEGLDNAILKSIDFKKHAPKIICVEVVSGNNSDYSLETKEILAQNGFTPYFRAVSNIFFIKNEHLENIK